jgi:hypothetical protein
MGAGSTCPTCYGFCWFMWLYEGKLGDLVDSMHARSSLTYDKRKDSLLQFNNILRLSEDLEKSLFTGPKKNIITYLLLKTFIFWLKAFYLRTELIKFIFPFYSESVCTLTILQKPIHMLFYYLTEAVYIFWRVSQNITYLLSFLVAFEWVLFFLPRFDFAGASCTPLYELSWVDVVFGRLKLSKRIKNYSFICKCLYYCGEMCAGLSGRIFY